MRGEQASGGTTGDRMMIRVQVERDPGGGSPRVMRRTIERMAAVADHGERSPRPPETAGSGADRRTRIRPRPCRFGRRRLAPVLALEPLDAALAVDELLTAGEERMALGADSPSRPAPWSESGTPRRRPQLMIAGT